MFCRFPDTRGPKTWTIFPIFSSRLKSILSWTFHEEDTFEWRCWVDIFLFIDWHDADLYWKIIFFPIIWHKFYHFSCEYVSPRPHLAQGQIKWKQIHEIEVNLSRNISSRSGMTLFYRNINRDYRKYCNNYENEVFLKKAEEKVLLQLLLAIQKSITEHFLIYKVLKNNYTKTNDRISQILKLIISGFFDLAALLLIIWVVNFKCFFTFLVVKYSSCASWVKGFWLILFLMTDVVSLSWMLDEARGGLGDSRPWGGIKLSLLEITRNN